MIDNNDIKKLKEVFATKEEVNRDISQLADATMRGFHEMNERIDRLESKVDVKYDRILNAIDALGVKVDRYFQEQVMLGHQFNRHDAWIHHLADVAHTKLPEA